MSHTANTEPTTRRDAREEREASRRGAVEDVILTEDGRVLNDPTHLDLPDHGNTPGAWAMVALVVVGFVAGCIGLLADWFIVVWIGLALMAVGLLVGLVTGRTTAGSGQDGQDDRRARRTH